MRKVSVAVPILLITSVLGFPARAYVGAPDPFFGAGGVQITDLAIPPGPPSSPDFANAVAIQADGQIIVGGETNMGFMQAPFALIRLFPTGAFDPFFADQGKQYGYFTVAAGTSKIHGVAVQPDGRIVVAGTRSDGTTSHMGVARYSAAGVLEARVTMPFVGLTEGRAVQLRPDGKIVVVGSTQASGSARTFAVARLNPDLSPDTSFAGGGPFQHPPIGGNDEALAVAVRPSGDIVAVGRGRNLSGTHDDIAVLSMGPLGFSGLIDVASGSSDRGSAVALPASGGILIGGGSGSDSVVLRMTDSGQLDATFGAAGKFLAPGGPIVSLALQGDGKVFALTQDFQLWRLTATGAPDSAFGVGGRVVLAMPAGASASAMALQANGRVVVVGSVNSGQSSDFVVARIDPTASAEPTPSTATIDFGAQSMMTTSPALALKLTNGSAMSVALNPPAASSQFAITAGSCGPSLLPLSSCEMSVTFTPTATGRQAGRLFFDKFPVIVAGVGERSLVIHYYRSILRRAPDAGGKAYWESEATRVSALGANVNEVWFSMAQTFFASAEYPARDPHGFVLDLYNTFFNRLPDSAGYDYWIANFVQGMPREAALAEFMFSPEFANFTRNIFGSAAARADVNAVMDFYRGLLARLPDDAGLAYWAGRFRTAQCQNGAAVTAEAEAITSAFALSSEYAMRGRTNAQYVGDLYNAFLRRGGDLAGVLYWIDQLATGARTREQVRVEFRKSPEFQARVNAIVQQGCIP